MANRHGREQGFTLMELLIAIFIFGIVIASVYGAYRATFTIINGSENRMSISRGAQVAMERIADDLRSVVAGQGGELRGERHDVSGFRADKLTFVSAFHLTLSKKDAPAGRAIIAYSADPDEKSGLLRLYRLDRVLLPGTEKEKSDTPGEILATGLKEVSFSYVDAEGKANDDWESKADREEDAKAPPKDPLLPALIYVKLVFARSPEAQDAADKENGVVFRTAVALPEKAKARKEG